MSMRPLILLLITVLSSCTSPTEPVGAQDLGQFLTAGNANPPLPQVARSVRSDISADRKARMLVIGDSLADGFGHLLRQRVVERDLNITVTNRGRSSSGLSRSDFYNWPSNYRSMANQIRPDIVVAHFGANDMQSVIEPNGRTSYGTDAWEEAYRRQIREVLRIAHETGGVVYWIGPGADGHPNLHAHLTRLNDWIAEETARAGAVYFPIRPFTSPPDGSFARTVSVDGRPMAMRTADKSHFTLGGYQLVADRLLDDLIRNYPVLAPGSGASPSLFAALLQ